MVRPYGRGAFPIVNSVVEREEAVADLVDGFYANSTQHTTKWRRITIKAALDKWSVPAVSYTHLRAHET